jgi:CAAX protease family protein
VIDAKKRNSLIFFLALTFAISLIFYGRSFSGASLSSVVPFLMWTPGVCAIVTQLVFNRTMPGLGWRSGPWRYLGLAILLPFGYCLAIYVPVWVVGAGRFEGSFLA